VSRTSDRIDRVVTDVHALEAEFKYGKISKLIREVEYLEKARADQSRTIHALCRLAGISVYDLQPTDGSE